MKKALFTLATIAVGGAAHAESATYAIDPTHTFVTFEARHFNTSTLRGRFDKKEGSVSLDRAARNGKVTLTLDPASVSTGVALLDARLKGDDFFAVAQSPTVTFVSETMAFDGDKVSSVSGQLTLRGKTLPVTLNASRFDCYRNPLLRREVCGGDFEATIHRSQWGMNDGLNAGVPDDIRLLIQVEAVKQ